MDGRTDSGREGWAGTHLPTYLFSDRENEAEGGKEGRRRMAGIRAEGGLVESRARALANSWATVTVTPGDPARGQGSTLCRVTSRPWQCLTRKASVFTEIV